MNLPFTPVYPGPLHTDATTVKLPLNNLLEVELTDEFSRLESSTLRVMIVGQIVLLDNPTGETLMVNGTPESRTLLLKYQFPERPPQGDYSIILIDTVSGVFISRLLNVERDPQFPFRI